MKPPSTRLILVGLFLLSLFLRGWGIGDIGTYFYDEGAKIPATINFVSTGNFLPENFAHPPLRFFVFDAGMRIFGNNAYGWRLPNVILGALSVLALYLVALEFFQNARMALFAACALAVDPLHIAQSRTAYEEIFLIFFFLFTLYFTLRFLRGSYGSLYLAGVFMGLVTATKWYLLPMLIVIPVACLVIKTREQGWNWMLAMDIFLAFVAVPVAVYLLTFYPWFGRGYSFPEFVQMQINAYRELQATRPQDTAMGPLALSHPVSWFLKPVFYGFHMTTGGAWTQFHVEMNNFPLWLMTLPALIFITRRAWISRDRFLSLFVILFLVSYIQFLFVDRPMFIYSLLVILPFVLLTVSFLIVSLLERHRQANRIYGLALFALLSWGLFLYPLVLGRPVLRVFYSPLLALGNMM